MTTGVEAVEQLSNGTQNLRISTAQQPGPSTGSAKPPRSGGRGGGRGARQDASPSIQLSKALSYILRHGAAKEHLKVRPDGYISLAAVLARPKVANIRMDGGRAPSEKDVLQIVESNDKKRFEVTDEPDQGGQLIRAVQGHSLAEITSLEHIPLTLSNLSILGAASSEKVVPVTNEDGARLPEGVEILHGTSRDAWDKIRASGGLHRMKRNHIHLAKGRPGSDAVISGMRSSSAVIVHVDIIAALRDNIAFSVASNGAVLTSGQGETGALPLKYLSRAEESKTGKIIWDRDTEV